MGALAIAVSLVRMGVMRYGVAAGCRVAGIDTPEGAVVWRALVPAGEVSRISRDDIWVGWKPEHTTVIPDRHVGH